MKKQITDMPKGRIFDMPKDTLFEWEGDEYLVLGRDNAYTHVTGYDRKECFRDDAEGIIIGRIGADGRYKEVEG